MLTSSDVRMPRLRRYTAIILIGLLLAVNAKAESITYIHVGVADDYVRKVLILALEKTRDSHGEFTISETQNMSKNRLLESVSSKKFVNPVFIAPPSYFEEDIDYLNTVYFPVKLGILGYRVCAHHKSLQSNLLKARDQKALQKFTFGLGKNWDDAKIMRENGFEVTELGGDLVGMGLSRTILNLYKYASEQKLDLFCRGANELLFESKEYLSKFDNLMYDRSMTIYYPLPFFFNTHKTNGKLASRIKLGLVKSFENGEIQDLWNQYFASSVTFSNMKGRRVFTLKNPLVSVPDPSYEKYIYRP